MVGAVASPCGGPNAYISGGLTEGEQLRTIGVQLGFPETAFLRESCAPHTFENAQFSQDAIVAAGMPVKWGNHRLQGIPRESRLLDLCNHPAGVRGVDGLAHPR